MIKLTNVSKIYKNGTHALYDLNLEIADSEFVYIVGSTGSGKSTLIKLLNGEEVPSGGTVMVSNTNVGKLRHSKVPLYRRTIGVVFQDYRLLPKKTVFENIAYALEVVDTPTAKLRQRVREVIKLVGLSDKSNAFPSQLSGGQQQRVAIARAIANRPKILIADEPTGNLDPVKSEEIIRLFEKINTEEKTTILIVTHDIEIVRNHPKRTITIEDGHIASDRMGATSAVNSAFKPEMTAEAETVEPVNNTPEAAPVFEELKPVEEVKNEENDSELLKSTLTMRLEEVVAELEAAVGGSAAGDKHD